MDSINTLIVSAYSLLLIKKLKQKKMNKQKKKRIRSCSIRDLNTIRLNHNFKMLFERMIDIDEEWFIKYVRMDAATFQKLLEMFESKIRRKFTVKTISPRRRLAITLYYLAQGDSMQDIAWSFSIGKKTVSTIISETCQVIWETLSPVYLKEPTVDDFLEVADGFYSKWNLPNCIGALDGKHIHIQAPKKSGSVYFNYKKRFSLVLMAVCNHNYEFLMVDIGAEGSMNDAGIFKESCFGRALENGTLKIPPDSNLPNTEFKFPYFLAADEAFPLKRYIMRPIPGKYLSENKRIYNYRLSRGRRCIENAFGILANRWRIFRNDIIASEETIKKVTGAAVCLHNYLMKEKRSIYSPAQYEDSIVNNDIISGTWRNDYINSWNQLGRTGSNNYNASSAEARNVLLDYFCTIGAVPWQRTTAAIGSFPNET